MKDDKVKRHAENGEAVFLRTLDDTSNPLARVLAGFGFLGLAFLRWKMGEAPDR